MQTKGFRANWEAGLRRIATIADLTLIVDVRDLPTIDPKELIKLRICDRLIDIASWVAKGALRQQVGAVGGDAQIDPKMPQAAVAAPRTIAQRLHRGDEEVQRMNRMAELMESRGMKCGRFDGSITPDSHLQFERRRFRQRTDGAGTSAQ
ncbi:hypothetical protein Tco_1287056 [Tanacetum coccineum]